MEKRGYVFNGLIFLVFVPVLVMAIHYSSTVSNVAYADYQELKSMKVYYTYLNIYRILDQAKDLSPFHEDQGNGCHEGGNLVRKIKQYIGVDTTSPTSGPPVTLHETPSNKLKCTGTPPREIQYLNVTSRETNPTVRFCHGANCEI